MSVGILAFFGVMAVIPLVTPLVFWRRLMMFLSGRANRVYVNGRIGQVLQPVQQPLVRFSSNTVAFLHRQIRVYGYVHLG